MLRDFFTTIASNYNVIIVDCLGNVLETHNGKKEIIFRDSKYFNYEVLRVDIKNNNTFEIMVYSETEGK